MYSSQYSTIAQESVLQALGPFRTTSTNESSFNDWQADYQINIAFSCITWSVGVASQSIGMDKNKNRADTQDTNLIDYEQLDDSAYTMMLASEAILGKDWDTPEEDAAWADL